MKAKEILDFIKIILTLLIKFDSNYLVLKQYGGANAALAQAAQMAPGMGMGVGAPPPPPPQSQAQQSSNLKQIEKEVAETANSVDEILDEAGSTKGNCWYNDIWDAVSKGAMWAWQQISTFITNWIFIPILVGSVYPAVPFLAVMGGMMAILKYFMMFFRKL